MNAKEFVKAIAEITPSKEKIQGNGLFSEEFIETYISGLHIKEKTTHIDVSADNAIIDLILNYDLSELEILALTFNAEENLVEDEKYIYVGWIEAFPFAILKSTGEVVEVDWEDSNYIVSYLAVDQQCFLNVLIEVEKLNQRSVFSSINSDEEKEILRKIQEIAGGRKYSTSCFFDENL